MAEIQVANSSAKQLWISNLLSSYVRTSGYKPYMGRGDTSIIRLRSELQTSAGNVINVPLMLEFNGRGVEGAEVLEGNEEATDLQNDQVRVNWLRNAFTVPKSSSYLTEIDLFEAGKARLTRWSAVKLRNSINAAFKSIIIQGGLDVDNSRLADTAVSYENSTAAQRNAYLVNNQDRMLFGALRANSSSGVWATSLANVDATDDKMSSSVLMAAKALAKQTTNSATGIAINPYMDDATAGREWYVVFMGSEDFYNASRDPLIYAADKDARVRGVDSNPIFQGGDRIYEGMILREIPELDTLKGVGAGGVNVGRSFMCGQGALAIAYGQMPKLIADRDRDYGFRPSFGIEELRGQKKVSYSGTNYGIVELFTAAPQIG